MAKNLYRSRKNKMLAGVAGGVAEYFDIDPVIVRAAFILSVFVGGAGVIAYLILWIILPEDKADWYKEEFESNFEKPREDSFCDENEDPDFTFYAEMRKHDENKKSHRSAVFGVILIAIGVLFLFDNLFFWLDFEIIVPAVFILLGIAILFKKPLCRGN